MSLITKIFFFHFQSCHERIVHPALLVFVELQKNSSKYNVTWGSWKRRSLWPTRKHSYLFVYVTTTVQKLWKFSINVQMMVEKLRPLNTCEVLVNCTIVCKTDVNYILTGSLGKKPLCSMHLINVCFIKIRNTHKSLFINIFG